MIVEIGHYALILALIVSLVQFGVPIIGLRSRQDRLMKVAFSAAQTQFMLVLVSYVALSWAFAQNDFSVTYVADNSHSQLPLMYRLSAVWGAHEGSLLLWVLMLAGWTLAVSIFNRRLPLNVSATTLAVLGAISMGFLLFMLMTSNPFERQFPVPADGKDLNPLLQDPGLIFHPPMLYMGYVGFSVAFAFAISALLSGYLDAAWARWTRPWTTTAWLFLTGGITLGSWWAYHELGWGGWWFWDPVENASFMPWLVGTALIHSLAVTEKRGLLKSWTLLLAILAFGLCLLGTFLVRSGVVISVHAFATDPARGVFILAFLVVVLGASFALYAWRAPQLISDGELTLFSREGLLLINNVFLVVSAATVLLGTLYPLLLDVLNVSKVSVGPPYFNATFIPLFAPLILLVGFAATVSWKRARAPDVFKRLRVPLMLAIAASIITPLYAQGQWSLAVIGGCFLGFWAMASSLLDLWRRARSKAHLWTGFTSIPASAWGMSLAHIGLGVWALGVTMTSAYSVEKDVRLSPGGSVNFSGYEFTFEGARASEGPNYRADTGTVRIEYGGRQIALLHPEKRIYNATQMPMTEAAVSHTLGRDLYVALGEPLENGDWALRIYVKPMMRLVWWGGVLMVLGGLLAVADRRYRLGRLADRALSSASTQSARA